MTWLQSLQELEAGVTKDRGKTVLVTTATYKRLVRCAEAVDRLHIIHNDWFGACEGCGATWPCKSARALDRRYATGKETA